MPGIVYEPLEDVIPFNGFDYANWKRHEDDILAPRLAKLGYTDIFFGMGEFDSFGPLTRICYCKAPDGSRKRFIYG